MARYKLLAEDTSTGQLKKSESVSLNVKDFGAYSDGTNATATRNAIGSAIVAATAAGGQEVYLPAGTYLVNSAIIVPGGVTLRGDGADKTIITAAENDNILNLVEGSGIYATLGPKVYDLQVKGDKAAGFQIGIFIEDDLYMADVVVENVRINTCGSHGMFIGKAFSSRFVNIYSNDNTGYPFVIDAPNMPGNHYESLYAQDVSSGANCGFRIRRGDVKLVTCNGINSSSAGSYWAIVGMKDGVDGATSNVSAFLELSNCNIESSKGGGIKCYYNSVVSFEGFNSFVPDGSASGVYKCLDYEVETSLFPPYFTKGRMSDKVVFAQSESSTISGTVSINGTTTVTGSGTSFLTALVAGQLVLANGQVRKVNTITNNTSFTVTSAFSGTASGLTLTKYFYAENELVHSNDLPPLMTSGQGMKISGAGYRNGYYNTTNSRTELLYRADAFLARQTVTATSTFSNPGARYFEVNPSAALTLTLPWPGWYSTQELIIVKDVSNNASVNNITIGAASGGTINGAGSLVLNKNGQCVILAPNENSTDYRIVLNFETSPDVVNVKAFGAKGDNSTNDTTAITNALTFAATQKRPVYLPTGTYIVTTLQLGGTDGLIFYGDGAEKTIIKSTGNDSIVKVTSGTANRLQLRDFTVAGNSTGANQIGVHLSCNTGTNAQYSNVILENIHTKDTGGTGFRFDANSAFTAKFKNLTVRNAGNIGIDCDTGGPNLLFENCYVFSVAANKAAYRFRRGKPTIVGCNGVDPGLTGVTWAIVGADDNLGDPVETYCFPTFIGCNFEDYTSYGIDCYVGSTVNLLGCSFQTVATNTANDINFRGGSSSTGFIDGTTSFYSPSTGMQNGRNIRSSGRIPLNILSNKVGGFDNTTGVNASYTVTNYYNAQTSTTEKIPCLENSLTRTQITGDYTQYERGLTLIDCRHSAPLTVTLIRPDNAIDGTVVEVKDASGAAATNNITVQSSTSGNIDGASTYVINQNYQSVKFYCDGTNWFTLGKPISTGSGTTINSTNSLVPYRSSSTAFSDSNIIRSSTTVTELRDITTGSNAQTLRVYGTSDNGVSAPTNYVRAAITGSSTGLTIGMESGGTGSANQNITLSPTGTGFLRVVGGTIRGDSDIKLEDSSGGRFFRAVRANAWTDSTNSAFFQVGGSDDYTVFTSNIGTVSNRMLFTTNRFNVTDNDYTAAPVPTGLVQINTKSGSGLKPLIATVEGTSNGIEITTSGLLQKIGTGGIDASSLSAGTVPSARGGAGTVTGILKANGSGAVSAAVSGTDYAPATSGTSILYGSGSGGFSSVTVGTGLSFSGGTLSSSQSIVPTWTGVHTFNTGTTPSNVILLDIASIGSAGTRDSHNLIFRGRSNDGADHLSEWRLLNDVTSNAGASTFLIQSRIDANGFADRLSISDGGTVTATAFSGSGASLSNLNASNLSSGTVPLNRITEVLAVTDLTTYNGSSGSGSTALRATITSPLTNDVLLWDGSNWVNGFNSISWENIGAASAAGLSINNSTFGTTITQSTGTWGITWSGNTTSTSLFRLSSTNTSATGYLLDVIADTTGSNMKPFRLQARQATVFDTDAPGNITLSPRTVTSGNATALALTAAAHSGYTASTEITDINFNLNRTINRSAGAVTLDRAFRVQGRTLAFSTSSTVTDAINLDVETVSAGTNATITRSTGLRVKPSTATHHGIWVDGTASYTGDAATFGVNGSRIVRFVGVNGSMNSVLFDSPALANTATEGFAFISRIDSASNPSGTPSPASYQGSSPIVLQSDTSAGRYRFWSYLNSGWRKIGDSIKEEKIWLPAAGVSGTTAGTVWDLPSTSPATVLAVNGTNIHKGVLQFADTGGELSAQTTLYLPSDFTGSIDANIIWYTPATTGNCKWFLTTSFTSCDATATDDGTFNTASTVTTAAPGTANRVTTSTITGVASSGSGANKLMHLKISRNGSDASDTIANVANLIGVEITIRRTI